MSAVTPIRGSRQRKNPTKRTLMVEVQDLRQEIGTFRRQLGQLALKHANNLALLQEQTHTNFELIWALAEYLKEECGFDISEEILDDFHKRVVRKFRDEKIEDIKSNLPPGKGFCTMVECLHVDDYRKFFPMDPDTKERADDPKCPKCNKHEGLHLVPPEETKEEVPE